MAGLAALSEPLELEHCIGYSGRYKEALKLHQQHETGMVYALGATGALGAMVQGLHTGRRHPIRRDAPTCLLLRWPLRAVTLGDITDPHQQIYLKGASVHS